MRAVSLLPDQLDNVLAQAAKRRDGQAVFVKAWGTDHRGPLLLCRCHSWADMCTDGHLAEAVAMCQLADWRHSRPGDAEAFRPLGLDLPPQTVALWRVEGVQRVPAQTVQGRRFLYAVGGIAMAQVVAVNPDGTADVRLVPDRRAPRTGLPDVHQAPKGRGRPAAAPKPRPAPPAGPSLF